MIVLGICDSMNSGATLVADGKILAAVSEESVERERARARHSALEHAEWLDPHDNARRS